MSIKLSKVGFHTLVMDQGRKHTRSLGIPTSGVIDLFQYWWGNGLVGNFDFSGSGPPLLEIISGGVEIRFLHPHQFALTGSRGEFTLDGNQISTHTTYFAQKGQVLEIRSITRNGTVYLAIDGQWKVDRTYGSASADILSPFPGTSGSLLRKNTLIDIEPTMQYISHKRGSPEYVEPMAPADQYTLRLTAGPELSMINIPKNQLLDRCFTITRASNKMGLRLDSELKPEFQQTKMISSIVVPGTLQWPVGGNPILLLPNCQTTGGYPRIGVVVDADMWKLAYIGAGDRIKFKWVTRDEALYLRKYQLGQFIQAWNQTFKQPLRHHLLLY